jgi:hypothetical protein
MNDYGLLFSVIGLLLIFAFSVLAARAQEALWSKCKQRESCLQMQQHITMGKSHCR